MSRRTRALTLTLVGPSLLAAAGCGADPPAARPAPATPLVAAELGPQEERALGAALAANALGNGALHPLPALPVVAYASATSEPPPQAGGSRRYPSSTYRRSPTFIAPYHWTTSRYHAPAVYHPSRTSSSSSRPATTSRAGGFGTTGRAVSS